MIPPQANGPTYLYGHLRLVVDGIVKAGDLSAISIGHETVDIPRHQSRRASR